jgi:sugar phosphate isomerase/epimerase
VHEINIPLFKGTGGVIMSEFQYSYQAGGLWGDVYEGIARLAKCGYDAVEIAGVTGYFHEAAAFRGAAEAEGLAVSSVCTNCAELDLAYPRKGVRDQGVAYMKRVVDFAAALGAGQVIINPTRLTKWTPLADLEAELAWGAESVAAVADYAAGAGVGLCVEVWNRYDTYLINRAEQGRAFVDRVNRDNVGLMLDTFHLNIEETNMAKAILDSKGYLVHLHTGDSNRAAPGMGHMDFLPLLQALADIDYQGYVTMELVPPGADPETYEAMHDMTAFFHEYPVTALKTLKALEAGVARK